MPAAQVRCTYWRGCTRPPVKGRAYCAEHVAAIERRAAELRAKAGNAKGARA